MCAHSIFCGCFGAFFAEVFSFGSYSLRPDPSKEAQRHHSSSPGAENLAHVQGAKLQTDLCARAWPVQLDDRLRGDTPDCLKPRAPDQLRGDQCRLPQLPPPSYPEPQKRTRRAKGKGEPKEE